MGIKKSVFFLISTKRVMENQFLKKKSYVMYWHSPALEPSVGGSFLGKTTLNSIDTYFFFKFSQNWHTYSIIPPLPPQYMVLLHLDQNGAGERHSLKDLPEIQRIHWGSKGGGGYVKYVRYILNYLFSIEKKIGLVISTMDCIISWPWNWYLAPVCV